MLSGERGLEEGMLSLLGGSGDLVSGNKQTYTYPKRGPNWGYDT